MEVARMAKTLVDLDRGLLDQVQQILKQPSMAATIREALARVVRQRVYEEFLDEMANLDDDERVAMTQVRNQ
jgi:Arc/MetJ family transcription regulator